MSAKILLTNPKFKHNVGAVIRAASCFGACEVLWTGERVTMHNSKADRLPREERMRGYQDVAFAHVDRPRPITEMDGFTPVAIELLPGSEPLPTFEHPENALYVFGPEDGTLSSGLRSVCHRFVSIPSKHCLNLSAAVYVVLYDRMVKRALIDGMPNLNSEGRGTFHDANLDALFS